MAGRVAQAHALLADVAASITSETSGSAAQEALVEALALAGQLDLTVVLLTERVDRSGQFASDGSVWLMRRGTDPGRGLWTYLTHKPVPDGAIDLSVSQFGVLGLWSAVQAGAVQVLVIVALLLSQTCAVAVTKEMVARGRIRRTSSVVIG